ncbi:hypothetical protein Pla22_10160 [Rubripirellula amarantea]|uniref:Uncharacterized protein n=1 Tax=Rubripirellula amarantea TaxID=2527999 RepID=A0A5C5WS23_9BACT|nr:hypothetical protein Pla22_10160 [Rubripirellula amarantea]
MNDKKSHSQAREWLFRLNPIYVSKLAGGFDQLH